MEIITTLIITHHSRTYNSSYVHSDRQPESHTSNGTLYCITQTRSFSYQLRAKSFENTEPCVQPLCKPLRYLIAVGCRVITNVVDAA
jgi:hypothetical protein